MIKVSTQCHGDRAKDDYFYLKRK